ncbi:MAG: bifunctional [glutamate--ammonia ligase]-adenylyl-L-tyrosine phosphorylase/[glutamate--ammonia-ligase] adenylyltransferase, partial [Gammaproteobacteria bacterium]|nr:bifunctional [glutamate--ammonia ligase]-adenylyl-L-tyrosine phosphorylase/[glutamate--ammonia-ligase] adenylyltransferase [Gammaproteobacteria bacterium]
MKEELFSVEDQFHWRELSGFLRENAFDKDQIEQIHQLAIASSFALNQLSKNPQWTHQLIQLDEFETGDFPAILAPDQPVDMITIKHRLRIYRHNKLIQIIFLDVVKKIPLRQTLKNLSELADLLITETLGLCEKQLSEKHGQPFHADGSPMNLNIIAMGKLGGHELNFSSDIDLICCYANDGELKGFGQLSYSEYFARVVRMLSNCLSETNEDGFVYRVDLRLRPWGDSGPVALSHAGLEHYYQLHGREWEQYAMVKARIISGSKADRSYLKSILRPFVYRKYHDYRVFEGLASLKDKIDQQARSRGMQQNIKLGSGGIREIEFFVQAFQILKGGRNNQLQTTEIFTCFEVFEQQSIIPVSTVHDLKASYEFLRDLENKIQMLADQQTHSLPEDEISRNRIARALSVDSWEIVASKQQQVRESVSRHFKELFKRDDQQHDKQQTEFKVDPNIATGENEAAQFKLIQWAGISPANELQQQLNQFFLSRAWSFMSAKAKKRFTALLPNLLVAVGKSERPLVLFERLLKLFSSIAGRSVYFELLHQSELLLIKLCDLFDKSEWIAEEVSRYPMLLEHLIVSGRLEERFNRKVLASSLQRQLDNVLDDTELELDVLRLFKREQTIVIATAELAEEIGTADVGNYLSELAEILLDAVYRLAKKSIETQFGIPQYSENEKLIRAEMAIIGYGKLGGNELHYQSDLDLIFLHNSQGSNQQSSGPKMIDNSHYFARLAQKVISMTSVLTGSGKLYEIDSRLRPEGNSGLLVSSAQAYHQYQLEKAWTWEHQALVRARQVVGNESLAESFRHIRNEALGLSRDINKLIDDILNMREKMYQAKQPAEGEFK